MPALTKLKQELFAQAVATGVNATQAAISAGYSKTRASAQGCNLKKDAKVAARIRELTVRIEQQVAHTVAITKDSVIHGIARTIELALAAKRYGDALAGYRLIGQHLRLWDPAEDEVGWDGDLSKLTEQQLHNMAKYWRKLADPAVVAAAERRHALESGEIIDVVPEPAAIPSNPAAQEDGW